MLHRRAQTGSQKRAHSTITSIGCIRPSSTTSRTSTRHGTNYLAQNSFYDRNSRPVARPPPMRPERKRPTTALARQYQARTVIAFNRRHIRPGAYQYSAPTPIPTLSSMSGGSNGVLTLCSPDAGRQRQRARDRHVRRQPRRRDRARRPGSTSPTTTTTSVGRASTGTTRPIGSRQCADYGSGDPSSGAGSGNTRRFLRGPRWLRRPPATRHS